MPPEIVELIERWDGQQVVCRYDRPSGAWMFIAMHSTTRGPAAGGTRMRTYEHTADGLADAMRLASAMTKKFAILSMPVGGGKGVLAVPTIPRGSARRELFA